MSSHDRSICAECIDSIISEYEKTSGNAFCIIKSEEENINTLTVSYKKFAQDIRLKINELSSFSNDDRVVAIEDDYSYEAIVNILALIATDHCPIMINPLWDDGQKAEWLERIKSSLVNKNDNTVLVYFSSGTSGKTKAICFSLKNFLTLFHTEDCTQIKNANNILNMAPIYHIGAIRTIFGFLNARRTICISRGAKYFEEDMVCYAPDMVAGVPMLAEQIARRIRQCGGVKEASKYIGKNLKSLLIFGAKSNSDCNEYLMNQGIELWSAYGMTETAGIGLWGVLSKDNPYNTGAVMQGVKAKIENDELLISGDCVARQLDLSENRLIDLSENGWLHTGDLAKIDDLGNIQIFGKKKEIIILSNGKNVNPQEIEEKLLQSPDIIECVVYESNDCIGANIYSKNADKTRLFIDRYNDSVPFYLKLKDVNISSMPLKRNGAGKLIRYNGE